MSNPRAVIINDIHYNINTLAIANTATMMAVNKANYLNVPLIVAGDLHDTKANLRGECVNAMLKTFSNARQRPIILVGNHCRINEKSEDHSLNFLSQCADIINTPQSLYGMYLIPYLHDTEHFTQYLKVVPKGSTIICHQGLLGADMGHYVQDKTSLPPETFDGYRVISGHYHKRQTIKCGKTGVFDYTGNPYTLSFGEANDGPKGFSVLMEDGSLEFVPTELRKHIIVELTTKELQLRSLTQEPKPTEIMYGDLVWIKISGPKSELDNVDKKTLIKYKDFKLDLIQTDKILPKIEKIESLTNNEVMDKIIDATDESEEHKKHLKDLWKDTINASN